MTSTTSSHNKRAELAVVRPRELPANPSFSPQFAFRDQIDRIALNRTALTFERIANTLRRAETGYTEEMCDLFEQRIEADAHLRAAFDNRNESVSQKPWTIVEGGDTDADKQAAQLLESALRLVPNFVDTLSHQLTAIPFGWSGSEIDWRLNREGVIAPVYFANVPHRRFVFKRETDEMQIRTDLSQVDGEALRPGKWWVTCRSRGRLTATAGLMRTAVWWSTMKTMSARDWMVLSSRFGIPYVTGEYDENISPDDKTVLKQAVQDLGTDGYAVFSNAAKIVIHEMTGTGGQNAAEGIHGALINICDTQNSKLVEGATLVSAVDGPGSHALGTVHENRYHDILQGDAEKLAESFSYCVGLPFVRFNGLNARPPRLKIHLRLNMSLEQQIDVALKLANQLENFELDEEQIRQMTLLRRPSPGSKGLRGLEPSIAERAESESESNGTNANETDADADE